MIAAMALMAAAFAQPIAADVTGLWSAPGDGGSVVRLERCEAGLCGYIVTSPHIQANPRQKDIRNRDAAQRDRPLRNLMFLNVRPLGPDRWGDGWVYNPEDGGLYKGSMTLKPDGSLRLNGCIVAPLCKSQTWRRVN